MKTLIITTAFAMMVGTAMASSGEMFYNEADSFGDEHVASVEPSKHGNQSLDDGPGYYDNVDQEYYGGTHDNQPGSDSPENDMDHPEINGGIGYNPEAW